jgi:TrpR-related protein YerC/YecD
MTKNTYHLRTPEVEEFFRAVLSLKTVDECKKFFRDSMTLQEIERLTQRWQIVKMLDQKVPYREIAERIGVSTSTVTRVAYWLHHGEGGWQLVLNRMKGKV